MKEKTVKQAYEEARKKFKLPRFEELDKNFDIAQIESTERILREVRLKIANKVESIGKQLEDVLQPDTAISNLFEAQNFDESYKKKVFEIFKKFMYWHRSALLLLIINEDKSDVDYIQEVTSSWQSVQQEIKPVLEKLKNVWIKEITEKEKLAYFG